MKIELGSKFARTLNDRTPLFISLSKNVFCQNRFVVTCVWLAVLSPFALPGSLSAQTMSVTQESSLKKAKAGEPSEPSEQSGQRSTPPMLKTAKASVTGTDAKQADKDGVAPAVSPADASSGGKPAVTAAAEKSKEKQTQKVGTPAVTNPASSMGQSVPVPTQRIGDFRFDEIPGFQNYKDIKANERKLQEGGRVYKIRWSRDGQTIGFTLDGQKKQFNVADKTVTDRSKNLVDKSLRDKVTAKPKVERARQVTMTMSPNKKWRAVYRDHNVVLMPKNKGVSSIKVTTDGKQRRRFGTCCWVYGEELDQQTAMWWSPSSRKLAYYEVDETEMADYHLTVNNTSTYTKLQTVRYPKSGDKNPKVALHIYDVDTRQSVQVQLDGNPDQYLFNVHFSPDGEDLIFSRMSRRQNQLDVMAADVRDGKTRVIVSEKQVTWQNSRPLMRFLNDGKRFIWETERTQWKQFELREVNGQKIADLTDFKEFPCHKIELVDETAGWIYYSAYSDPSNPYNLQLHRCNFEGSKRQRITSAALNHTAFQISPNHNYVVAVRERFDTPRSTVVYRCEDGSEVAVLAQCDAAVAKSMGLEMPEIFEFTANDGVTKIYGTLHKPANFDATKKYPLLIDVYGGPQSTGISNTWSPANPVCELGFLIAKVGNRGTIKRGKAFESANFRKLGGPDLDDQASAVQFLTQRKYIDSSRVGIWGHSYGGYLSALAILKYPDLFQVAVAGSPVTDWKNYDTIYTERYMQTPRENAEGYKSASCIKYAKNLKGKLLLVHGLIDDNVHPANTWQLAKALQDKDRRFDMMVYPGFRHNVQSTYDAIRWEYFYRHLHPTVVGN